ISRIHLHGDLDRSQSPGRIGDYANVDYIADIDSAEPDRRALLQTTSIIVVGLQLDFVCKYAARTAHEENQNGERDARHQHRNSDLQLRPLQLLLARHIFPRARSSLPILCAARKCPFFLNHSRLQNKVHARLGWRVLMWRVLIRKQAVRYAVAPQASVALSPNWMAITMASTEPSTLEAAFMAQAHSTAFSSAACPGSDGLLEKARSPVGNGIPMANPSGTKSTPLTITFAANGKPTRAFNS